MKKKYERPLIYMEQFMANQFIANCNVSITTLGESTMYCMRSGNGHSHRHNESTQVFTDEKIGCYTIIDRGSEKTVIEKALYLFDTVKEGSYVYGFNQSTDNSNGVMMQFKKVNGQFYYTDGMGNATTKRIEDDDCYGWYQIDEKLGSYINPFS